jgi:hypothetical protein
VQRIGSTSGTGRGARLHGAEEDRCRDGPRDRIAMPEQVEELVRARGLELDVVAGIEHDKTRGSGPGPTRSGEADRVAQCLGDGSRQPTHQFGVLGLEVTSRSGPMEDHASPRAAPGHEGGAHLVRKAERGEEVVVTGAALGAPARRIAQDR